MPANKLYWNYFIALESDLEKTSRFIEFDTKNFAVFSIELAHLLLAASSEIDVIAKLLCNHFDQNSSANNINDYQQILCQHISEICNIEVFIPRYNLSFKPWGNWSAQNNPTWWRSYNHLKHSRNSSFHEASLENVLSAMSALLIMNYEYYRHTSAPQPLDQKETTRKFNPESELLFFDNSYYYSHLIG